MRNLLAVFKPPEDSRHYHEFAVSLLDALFRQLDLVAPNRGPDGLIFCIFQAFMEI